MQHRSSCVGVCVCVCVCVCGRGVVKRALILHKQGFNQELSTPYKLSSAWVAADSRRSVYLNGV